MYISNMTNNNLYICRDRVITKNNGYHFFVTMIFEEKREIYFGFGIK